jgi:hypothetical protein
MPSSTPHFAGGALPLPEAEICCLARFAAKGLGAVWGLQPSLLTAAEVAAQDGLSRRWVPGGASRAGARPLATQGQSDVPPPCVT